MAACLEKDAIAHQALAVVVKTALQRVSVQLAICLSIKGKVMFGKFLPRSREFFDHFDNHASLAVLCCSELQKMFSANDNFQQYANRIQELEKQADAITQACTEELHQTFITPFEREDIHQLITKMDDVIDVVEDVAAKIMIYKLSNIPETAKKLAEVLGSSVIYVQNLIQRLRTLKDINAMKGMLVKIHEREHEADDLLRNAIGKLFDDEKNPLYIIKWKEIYELLEEGTDYCQDVANIVEGVIIERS